MYFPANIVVLFNVRRAQVECAGAREAGVFQSEETGSLWERRADLSFLVKNKRH